MSETTHAQLKNLVQLGAAIACIALYYIRLDETYVEEGYDNFEDYARNEHGLQKSNAYKLAQMGEVIVKLYPELAPDQTISGQIVHCPLGKPGALRPLRKMVSRGYADEEIREAFAEILSHSADPTEKRVSKAVQIYIAETGTGGHAPIGALHLRQMAARSVYDVIRDLYCSDRIATRIREVALRELSLIAEEEDGEEVVVVE